MGASWWVGSAYHSILINAGPQHEHESILTTGLSIVKAMTLPTSSIVVPLSADTRSAMMFPT